MTLSYLGSRSVGACVPVAVQAQAALDASVNAALPDIEAKLTGFANITAALTVSPPDLSGTITAALETVASLQAAVSGPTVTLQIGEIANIVAELTAQLAELQASLALCASMGALFATSGVHAYAYAGRADGLGPALQAALAGGFPGDPGGPGAQCNAIVLATTSSAAWAAMSQVFGV